MGSFLTLSFSFCCYYCGSLESVPPVLVWGGWHRQTDWVQTHRKYHTMPYTTGQGKAWWTNIIILSTIHMENVRRGCWLLWPQQNLFFPLMMGLKSTLFFPSSLLFMCVGPWAHGTLRTYLLVWFRTSSVWDSCQITFFKWTPGRLFVLFPKHFWCCCSVYYG